ncbi:hypothetical protein [Streptacidiphilus fuscans]|uniref:Uncharacterized protein n=1 Tax=Streptacidiphilus fuscans TaxID=2789292 RepID=A0A931B7P3_9ACTN|nr:hypothetical protein [Streptacidiphilus fuscans]MBF9071651.1 hypothetical protein [Streptacidiphilus fuscans]MBF9072862.1 hypothetical protein [Streptacidiphilus fuscans]
MAAFSEAQYKSVVNDLTSGLGDLSAKLATVPGKTSAAANRWWIPEPVAEAIVWCGNKLIELGEWLLKNIKELLEGAVAPVYMFIHGYQWESIKGIANSVSGNIQPSVLGATGSWQGDAATAYGNEITPQSTAAASIGTMADSTSTALYVCAGAGLAFYIALGAIVVKFIGALATAIIALGTAVFSWAGLLIVVEEAGVNTGLIGAAVAGLLTVLGAEANEMGALHGTAVGSTAFPLGHWPVAIAGT